MGSLQADVQAGGHIESKRAFASLLFKVPGRSKPHTTPVVGAAASTSPACA